jgi:pimeloyl-ACP methyl ester carboxylesterase
MGDRSGVEGEYFKASDGCRIHYVQLGERGSWVILIHGFTDSAERMWLSTGVAAALAQRHRVVALDNRNHGLSDKPEPYGAGRAEDVIELMDHLDVERAHIHGYSMGGGMMARMLATVPERFLTASFGGAGIMDTDKAMAAHAEALDSPMAEPTGPDAAAFRLLRQRSAARRRTAGARSGAGQHQRQPLEIDLRRISVPVLAINGEFDRPHLRTHRLWRELDDFHNVVLPGLNHMSVIGVSGQMPDSYVRTLVRFIGSNDGD